MAIPTNVASLMAVLSLNTVPFEGGVAKASAMMAPTGALALGVLGMGAIMAGTGIVATKMAGDFQKGITSLATGAGEQAKYLPQVADGIKKIAQETGTSLSQLNDGMYMISSGGFTYAKGGLEILKAAAEGAKVGSADLGVVADTVDTILKNFGENGALTATQATNALITTVANGKTHLEDLANSLSSVLPAGAAAGLGLKSVLGAMSTLTGGGINAAESATYLRQMIIALEAPSSSAKTALRGIGITTDELAAHMKKGLPDALEFVRKQLDARGIKEGSAQYVAAIREISGGTRQMQAMLYLLGGEGTTQDHLKTLAANVGKVGDAASKSGNQVTGWALVQQNMNQQFDRFKESLAVMMVNLGTQLLPIATKFFSFLADTALPAIQNLAAWLGGRLGDASKAIGQAWHDLTSKGGALYGLMQQMPSILNAVHNYFEGLASVWQDQIQPALVQALPVLKVIGIILGVVIVASIAAMVGALLVLAGAITGVMLIISLLVKAVGWAASMIPQAWNLVKANVVEVWTFITTSIANAWTLITANIKNALDWIVNNFKMAWQLVTTNIGNVLGFIGNFVGAVLGWFGNLGTNVNAKIHEMIIGVINKAVELSTGFLKALQGLPGKLFDLGRQLMQSLANGIKNGVGAVANAVKDVPLLGGAMADVSKGLGILMPKFAAQGGTFGEGEWGVVGENNPEAIRVQNGRAIITPLSGGRLAASPAGMAGGNGALNGGPLIVQIKLDGRQIAQATVPHLHTAIRNGTGNRKF